MSIDIVRSVLAEAGSGYLATTDGEQAAVRPMGCPTLVGDELWFATGVDSAKVAQIRKKPRVEFCAADSSWRYVRIAGECTVSTDETDRQTYLDLVPVVKNYFAGVSDPRYAVLRIKVDSIRLMTTEGETEVDVPSV